MEPSTSAALDQIIRARLLPGEIALGAALLAMSLGLAFRRQRLPPTAGSAPEDAPVLPDSLHEIQLFRLRYALTLVRGRLRPDERSARRLWLVPESGHRVSWRPPGADFPVTPDRALLAIAAGGRAIATVDPEAHRVALHEADVSRLHGLGRRGRALLLWPLILATIVFWILARVRLFDVLTRELLMPSANASLAILLATASFALTAFALLAPILLIISAVLRRIRRAELRRRYEPALLAYLQALER